MFELGDTRLPERFWAKVAERDCGYTSPCWIWTAARDGHGYGRYARGGHSNGMVLAHRAAYLGLVGPITHTLDHLCRMPACVNPAHAEDVTHVENVRRGEGGRNMRERTTCSRGHAFDGHDGKQRRCSTCDKRRNREYRARRKESDGSRY